VKLAPLEVQLSDDNYVPLRDGFMATVRVRTFDPVPPAYANHPQRSNIAPLADQLIDQTKTITEHAQKVVFDALTLLRPVAGEHVLEVTVSQFNFTRTSMRQLVRLAVFPALYPTNLGFLRPPPTSMTQFGPLSQQPVAVLLDDANNVVVRATGTVRVAASGPRTGVVQGTALRVANAEAPVRDGVAMWTRLQLAGTTPGQLYRLNFTFIPSLLPAIPRPLIQRRVMIPAARCNGTCITSICSFAPDRAIYRTGPVTVRIVGWPYLQHVNGSVRCRLAAVPPLDGRVVFVDECNVNCVLNMSRVPRTINADDGARRVPLQVSIDGGATFRNASAPFTILDMTPSSIRTRFNTAAADATPGELLIDPLGLTRLGNITIEIGDGHGNSFLGLDRGRWSVRAQTPSGYPLRGTLEVVATNGVAVFKDLALAGFYEPGRNFTLTFRATRTAVSVPGQATIQRKPMFARVGRIVTAQKMLYLVNTYNVRCYTPPVLSGVASAACLDQLGPSGLSRCVTSVPIVLTVVGSGFGTYGSIVRVGAKACDETFHDPRAPLTKLIATCQIPGPLTDPNKVTTAGGSALTVVLRGGLYSTSQQLRIRPNVAVSVTDVSGCSWALPPSTGNCSSRVSTNITIRGTNFGVANAVVTLVNFFSGVSFPCPTVVHDSASPTTRINCSLPPARGVAYRVQVTNTMTGESGLAEYAAVTFANRSSSLCPKNKAGQLCSTNGVCDFTSLLCACYNDTVNGYWTGAGCGECKAGVWGARCQGFCPACIDSRGSCSQGVTGNGQCSCAYGYGGPLCEIECPGGASNPCNGHGVCNALTAACSCNATALLGYWAQPSCATCDVLHAGSDCTIACPIDPSTGSVCADKGTCNRDGDCDCDSGYCSIACNASGVVCLGCVAGVWGQGCINECLGGRNNPCNGHGTCSDGPFGTGRCTCQYGYGGSACDRSCAPSLSNICSGHGVCRTSDGGCTCTAGWSLADCATPCPGNATCNGHGTCNQVLSTCTCSFGYAGPACDLTCAGGTRRPCNFHGDCQALDGSCVCYNDTSRGFWLGSECDTCQANWWTATCDRQCNKINGLQCNGKGVCDHSLHCTCFSGSATGYWTGENCTECKPGFYGAQCLQDCPGTACAPCNFHGNCSDGVNGLGTCTCSNNNVNGHWTGEACNLCASSYYGFDCMERCPQGTGNASGTCGGRGTCDDGTSGTGFCTCTGTFGGFSCSECVTGYYGPGCTRECPGSAARPCGGFGYCNSTEDSTGECFCTFGRVGASCELACPSTSRGPCNSVGQCVLSADGTAGVCSNCTQSATEGYWRGATCHRCQPGYFGSLCRNECPGGAADPCSGHGVCNQGVNGTGACNCFVGYAGASCQLVCAGGARLPCNNRGTCDANTAQCRCFNSSVAGFWDGANCTECSSSYQGSTCTVPCPLSSDGVPCSGRGRCYEGVCVTCDAGFCGVACDELTNTSSCTVCSQHHYGPSCRPCPGGAANPCSGNGTCQEGRYGSGVCYCAQGYLGSACEFTCRGPAGVPCNGNGICDLTDGNCTCRTGFAGEDCSIMCQGFTNTQGALPCNGVGTCDVADGSCTCDYGYGGTACEIECPGGVANPCNANGFCTSNGNCTCFQTAATGHWGGTGCNRCGEGYFGSDCKRPCVNGHSNANFDGCVCDRDWYGVQCDVPCVGLLEVGAGCYGHGTCNYGVNGDGRCECNTDYYTESCNVSCTRTRCNAELTNGQCDKRGVCECRDDTEQHWVMTATGQCDKCNISYFGELCQTECPCNGHGLCDRRTGSCSCYTGESDGYWSGKLCEKCADGFIGVRCQGTDVAISRAGAVSSSINNAYPPIVAGFLCFDPVTNYTYMGLEVVSVFNRAHSLLRSFESSGLAVACHIASATELYLFVYTNATAKFVVVTRATATVARSIEIRGIVDRGRDAAAASAVGVRRAFTSQSASARLATPMDDLRDRLARTSPDTLQAALAFDADAFDSVERLSAALAVAFESDRRRTERDRAGDATTFAAGAARASARTLLQSTVTTNSTAGTIDAAAFVAHGVVGSVTLGDAPAAPLAIGFFGGIVLIVPTDGSDVFAVSTGLTRITALCRGNETSPLTTTLTRDWRGTFYAAGLNAGGLWDVVVVDLPSSTPTDRLSLYYRDVVASECPGCHVAAMGAGNNGTLFATLVSDSQTYIARFGTLHYVDPDGGVIRSATNFSMRLTLESSSNATGMLIDTYAVQGYVAVNAQARPSTFFKFDLDSGAVSGQAQLSIVGADREVAIAMRLSQQYRLIQIFAPLSLLLRAVEVTAFAVIKAVPEFADTQGSTPVTVRGTGFTDGMFCVFGTSDRRIRAQFRSRREIVCPAPSGGSEACEGEQLEASIDHPAGTKTTNNKRTVRRVTTPIVRSITNNVTLGPFGFREGGTVEVRGVGFQECVGCERPLMKCKIYSPRDYRSLGPIIVIAQPLSSNSIRCVIPSVKEPLPIPTYLEVSADGTIFSNSRLAYELYGSDAALVVAVPALPSGLIANLSAGNPASDPSRFSVKSSVSTDLPLTVIDVTDQEVHSLGVFADTQGQHLIHASLYAVRTLDGNYTVLNAVEYADNEPGTSNDNLNRTVSSATIPGGGVVELHGSLAVTDGHNASAVFDGMTLVNAPVGRLTLRFHDLAFNWSAYLTFSITEGEPYRLFFSRKPSTVTKNTQPTLAIQPIVGLMDLSGNVLSTFEGKDTPVDVILVSYTYHQLGTDGAPSTIARAFQPTGNLFRIEGLFLTGRRGRTYRMNFTVPGLPEPTLMSDAITVGNCDAEQFGKYDSTECFPCPAQGICDGSLEIRAKDNWWRADNSTLSFYYCGAPNSGDSCVNDSSCRAGYRGPMCSLCSEGYGRAGIQCTKCVQANEALIVVVAVVIVGVFVLLVFTVMTNSARNLMAVTFRNLVTHMQILSRLGELQIEWPSLLATLWEVMNKVQIEPTGISPIDCAAGSITYFEKYIGVMVAPWVLVLVVAPLAWVFVKLRQTELDRPIEEAIRKVEATIDDGDEVDVIYEMAQVDYEETHLKHARGLGGGRGKKKRKRTEKHRQLTGSAASSNLDQSSNQIGTRSSVTLTSDGSDSDDDPTTDTGVDDSATATHLTHTAASAGGVPSVLGKSIGRKSYGGGTIRTSNASGSDSESVATRKKTKKKKRDRKGLEVEEEKTALPPRPTRDIALKPLLHVKEVMIHRRRRTAFSSAIIVTALVVFVLLYPTLVQSSGIVLKCETIDMGRQGIRRLFVRDRTVDCDSGAYKVYSTVAIAVLVTYGFFVPATVVATTLLVRKFGGQLRARTLLSFMQHGFKQELWYWETTNLLRKFAVMLIVVFVKDAKLQVILFMWSVVASFVMHLVFRPYTDELLHRVEAVGQSCMVISLNLVLLLFLPSVGDAQWGAYTLSVIVLLINIVAVLVYLGAIGYYALKAFKEWRSRRAALRANDGKWPAILALDSALQRLDDARTLRAQLEARHLEIICNKGMQRAEVLDGSAAMGLATDDGNDEDSLLIEVVDPNKTEDDTGEKPFGSFIAFAGGSLKHDPRGIFVKDPLELSLDAHDTSPARKAAPYPTPPVARVPATPGADRSRLMATSGFARRSVTFDDQVDVVASPAAFRASALWPASSDLTPGRGGGIARAADTSAGDGEDALWNLPDNDDFSPIVPGSKGSFFGDAVGAAFVLPSEHQLRREARSAERTSPASRALFLKAFGADSDDEEGDDAAGRAAQSRTSHGGSLRAAFGTPRTSAGVAAASVGPVPLTTTALRDHTRTEEERIQFGSDVSVDSEDTDDLLAAMVGGKKHVHPSLKRAQRTVGGWDYTPAAAGAAAKGGGAAPPSPIASVSIHSASDASTSSAARNSSGVSTPDGTGIRVGRGLSKIKLDLRAPLSTPPEEPREGAAEADDAFDLRGHHDIPTPTFTAIDSHGALDAALTFAPLDTAALFDSSEQQQQQRQHLLDVPSAAGRRRAAAPKPASRRGSTAAGQTAAGRRRILVAEDTGPFADTEQETKGMESFEPVLTPPAGRLAYADLPPAKPRRGASTKPPKPAPKPRRSPVVTSVSDVGDGWGHDTGPAATDLRFNLADLMGVPEDDSSTATDGRATPQTLLPAAAASSAHAVSAPHIASASKSMAKSGPARRVSLPAGRSGGVGVRRRSAANPLDPMSGFLSDTSSQSLPSSIEGAAVAGPRVFASSAADAPRRNTTTDEDPGRELAGLRFDFAVAGDPAAHEQHPSGDGFDFLSDPSAAFRGLDFSSFALGDPDSRRAGGETPPQAAGSHPLSPAWSTPAKPALKKRPSGTSTPSSQLARQGLGTPNAPYYDRDTLTTPTTSQMMNRQALSIIGSTSSTGQQLMTKSSTSSEAFPVTAEPPTVLASAAQRRTSGALRVPGRHGQEEEDRFDESALVPTSIAAAPPSSRAPGTPLSRPAGHPPRPPQLSVHRPSVSTTDPLGGGLASESRTMSARQLRRSPMVSFAAEKGSSLSHLNLPGAAGGGGGGRNAPDASFAQSASFNASTSSQQRRRTSAVPNAGGSGDTTTTPPRQTMAQDRLAQSARRPSSNAAAASQQQPQQPAGALTARPARGPPQQQQQRQEQQQQQRAPFASSRSTSQEQRRRQQRMAGWSITQSASGGDIDHGERDDQEDEE
jgi:hypothetical protein